MPSVAEQLRHAREKQNLSIHQVAEVTNIRTDHIRALEEGHYEVFAAPVYIRGFIRTYAGMLKLDVKAVLRDLEGELAQTRKFQESSNLSGKKPGLLDLLVLQLAKIHWKFWIAALVLLVLAAGFIIGYRAWRNYLKSDPLEKLGPGLYEPSGFTTNETLPLPAPARRN
jgi:cytoskeleton protein RodZ